MQDNPFIIKKILKWAAEHHKDGLVEISEKNLEIDQSILLAQLRNMCREHQYLSPTPKQNWLVESYSPPDDASFLISLSPGGVARIASLEFEDEYEEEEDED